MAPQRRGRPPVRKNKATPAKTAPDVSKYADREPTDYHKQFAKWLVQQVGYRPSQAESLKEAFLMGVSLATVTRPAFMASPELEAWREKTGHVKRGPKPGSKRASVEPEDDDFDDDSDDDDIDVDEDDFDDDADDSDDDFDEDDSDEDDSDDDDFDDEPEPTPAPVKRGHKPAPKKSTPPAKRTKPAVRSSKQPARSGTSKRKPADDDEILF